MSALKPPSTNKPPRAVFWRWLPHSIVLHVVALALLVWLWREHHDVAVVAKEKNQAAAQAVRLDQMRSQVEEMKKIRDEVAAAAKKREEEYAQSAQDISKAAAPRARELMEKIAQSQNQTREILDRAAAAQQKRAEVYNQLQQTPEADRGARRGEWDQSKQQLGQSLAEASTSVRQGGEAQQEALNALAVAGPKFDATRETLRRAAELQQAAEQAQQAIGNNRGEMESREWDLLRLTTQLESRQKELQEGQAKRDALRAEQAAAQQTFDQQNPRVQELKSQADAARQAADQNKTPESREAEKQANKAFRDAEDELRRADNNRKRATEDADRQQNRVTNELEANANHTRQQIDQLRQTSQQSFSTTQAALENAKQAQARAQDAQNQAAQQFQNAIAQADSAAPSPGKLPDYTPTATAPPAGATPEELYNGARNLEKELAELHRRQRAAELALIQHIPIQQAYLAVSLDLPNRPNFGQSADGQSAAAASGDGPPGSGDAALQQAAATLSAMAAGARQLQPGDGSGTGFYLDWTKQRDASDGRTAAAAGRKQQGDAADLTASMQGGSPGEGNDSTPLHDQYDRRAIDGASQPPVLTSDKIKSLPGRMVGSTGQGVEWMTVDSWYLVGPFDNPGRANRNLRFPPEERVDLDATYPGKDGHVLKWQFIQSVSPQFRPDQIPDTVYYAYTELWFEEPQNLWVAMGCDDNATIWIEDQLIYNSQDQYKAWSFAEAFRRVHFKKGINRVLYRIENGPRAVAFSMAVYLGKGSPPGQ